MSTATATRTEIEPGIYPDMPMDEYLEIDAASNTRLGKLKKSPAHLRQHLESPVKHVDPDSIGSALHSLVLEGRDVFEERYARAPEDADHRGHRPWKDFVASLDDGRIPMKANDYDTVVEMAEDLLERDTVQMMMEGVSHTEISIVWRDDATGLLCKGRPDAINPARGAVIDLKHTRRDITPLAFARTTYRYGYYRQAAFYRRGMNALMPEVEWNTHNIFAIEPDPPYAAITYRMREDAVWAGDEEIHHYMEIYARCVECGEWPAFEDAFVDLTLPGYAWSQLEEQLEWETGPPA